MLELRPSILHERADNMKIKLEKQHYQWGLTALLVIICSVLVFFIVYKFSILSGFFKFLVGILAPFIYGIIMAYLVCPIFNSTVRLSYRLINKGKFKFKHDLTISKIFGSIVAMALLIIVIGGFIWMVVPGLVDSISKVVDMLPAGIQKISEWIELRLDRLPIAQETIDEWSKNVSDYIIDYATNTIIPKSGDMMVFVSGAMINAFSVFFNFIIGMIICIYFLNIKDTLAAQAKKLIVAHCKENTAEEILEGAEYTNRTFGGFISGKIIDSLIVGIICFIVMTIFGWEYSLLISCIIGVTNIIPFFGPFIGGVPSALLLLMVDPMQCLYFVIFIVILQQIEGNVLCPMILGDSTGLSSFWVLFSVIVGGGLFGFVGMLIGTPIFAVIYAYCARALNKKLGKKGFSTNTLDYKVDNYRAKRPGKSRKKQRGAPILKERHPGEYYEEIFEKEDEAGADLSSIYESENIQQVTDEEIAQAEATGQAIMEATLVEYRDGGIDKATVKGAEAAKATKRAEGAEATDGVKTAEGAKATKGAEAEGDNGDTKDERDR